MTPCPNHPDVETVNRCSRCGIGYCHDCLVTIEGRAYCARCKTERLLDVRSGVDSMTLPLASNWKRLGAVFIDGLIINLPLYFITVLLMIPIIVSGQNTPSDEPPLWFNFIGIPFMFVNFLYEALMTRNSGQTIGKKALNIRIVRPDGSPITPGQAWGRAASRLLLGCCWIVDYIPAFFTAEKTALHDMMARTRVVEVM